MRDIRKYLGWTLFIGLILWIGFNIHLHLLEKTNMMFVMMPLILFSSLFPVLIGMLLRLPRLIDEIRQNKRWAVHWTKLIIIGIPTLYVVVTPILSMTAIGPYWPFSFKILQLMDAHIHAMVGLVLGYVVLDSVKQ
ncbi:hypothetical protein [Alkalihalobacterium chitinilyticum]|uniref:Uncharacterized protein n=1 Tax=Alkalihalobacterium chitinilyticum TaxID=2980103 RepID=A0ABT5VIC4_9BACI|nr:hypothetical protein [Alkalihalobacterium chitinilyticum]MDE5415067.1 hypothetical protein [Alkalihalobacterium chitinilyticum]